MVIISDRHRGDNIKIQDHSTAIRNGNRGPAASSLQSGAYSQYSLILDGQRCNPCYRSTAGPEKDLTPHAYLNLMASVTDKYVPVIPHNYSRTIVTASPLPVSPGLSASASHRKYVEVRGRGGEQRP